MMKKDWPFPTAEQILFPYEDRSPEKRPVSLGVTKDDCMKGGTFHLTAFCTPVHTVRWRANGKCKVWVTRPDEFRLPVKFGLRDYDYITEENADKFHRQEDCPHGHI